MKKKRYKISATYTTGRKVSTFAHDELAVTSSVEAILTNMRHGQVISRIIIDLEDSSPE